MGSAKRAVKVLDFDLHGSPYTHTKANVALNTIFLVLSIEQNGPPKGTRTPKLRSSMIIQKLFQFCGVEKLCLVGHTGLEPVAT